MSYGETNLGGDGETNLGGDGGAGICGAAVGLQGCRACFVSSGDVRFGGHTACASGFFVGQLGGMFT